MVARDEHERRQNWCHLYRRGIGRIEMRRGRGDVERHHLLRRARRAKALMECQQGGLWNSRQVTHLQWATVGLRVTCEGPVLLGLAQRFPTDRLGGR